MGNIIMKTEKPKEKTLLELQAEIRKINKLNYLKKLREKR
jgi:hypothetical protein